MLSRTGSEPPSQSSGALYLPRHRGPVPNPESQSWESGLTSFVQWLPDLSKLELSFMRHAEDDEHHRFSGLSRELYIPKLHTLILDCIDYTRWDMAFFLLR